MTLSGLDKTYLYEEHSAAFWSMNLGSFAAEMTRRSNKFALAAAAISALTGAAVWTTITESTKWWAQTAVAVMAVAAAVVGLWPKQVGYVDCAEKAADLATRYGQVLVDMRLAYNGLAKKEDGAKDRLVQAMNDFNKIRGEKIHLEPYPEELDRKVHQEYEAMDIEAPRPRTDYLPGLASN